MHTSAHALHPDADDDRSERLRQPDHGYLRDDSSALSAHLHAHSTAAAPSVDESSNLADGRALRASYVPLNRRSRCHDDNIHGALLHCVRRHTQLVELQYDRQHLHVVFHEHAALFQVRKRPSHIPAWCDATENRLEESPKFVSMSHGRMSASALAQTAGLPSAETLRETRRSLRGQFK